MFYNKKCIYVNREKELGITIKNFEEMQILFVKLCSQEKEFNTEDTDEFIRLFKFHIIKLL